MGKSTGFIEYPRQDHNYQEVVQRIKHYDEFIIELTDEQLKKQGARCMDCGIPFCHHGCPVDNIIPAWNDLIYCGDWKTASEVLHSTNNFPEFTGRICPAPCEASCTLNIGDNPVTIKMIEKSIVEHAWNEGWIEPQIARHKTNKQVAIVGSGPAGLACAQQLARAGHHVGIFEKQIRSGGLLRFGIPDFKLDKKIIDRRMAQMKTEGVEFHAGTHVGVDFPVSHLIKNYDAVVLAGGSEKPRDLSVNGRDLNGIYFAMDFLRSTTMQVQGYTAKIDQSVSAQGKHVVVIGGGDTGSDCIGTAVRQGAKSITQIEILPKPPKHENKAVTWPDWPNKLRTSTSQEEGCERVWSVSTRSFSGDNSNNLRALECSKVHWSQDEKGNWQMSEVENSQFELKAELVTLALGFVHPIHKEMLDQLGIEYNQKGHVKAPTDGVTAYKTSIDKVFSAGDMRRGQSLVVWAIREGRQCAHAVDIFLQRHSDLCR